MAHNSDQFDIEPTTNRDSKPADTNAETIEAVRDNSYGTARDKAGQVLKEARHSVVVSQADNKRILRKIDLAILPIILIVYCLQFLDKSTLSYASVFGILEDANLHGDQYHGLELSFMLLSSFGSRFRPRCCRRDGDAVNPGSHCPEYLLMLEQASHCLSPRQIPDWKVRFFSNEQKSMRYGTKTRELVPLLPRQQTLIFVAVQILCHHGLLLGRCAMWYGSCSGFWWPHGDSISVRKL